MPTPYNLPIQDACTTCSLPKAGRFCDLADSALEGLQQIKFTGIYPKGSVLFVEGEQPRGVYIVCSGKAKLTTTSSEGKTFIVRMAEGGEILGLGANILGTRFEQTAETTEPCQINFIPREDFLRFLSIHPEAWMRVAKQLSRTSRDAEREIRTLGLSQSTSEKVAKLLLEWCEHGDRTATGVRLKVLLTHAEIAQMIGTSRETVTRVLGDLRRKKIIDIKGSTVFVPKPDGLLDMITT